MQIYNKLSTTRLIFSGILAATVILFSTHAIAETTMEKVKKAQMQSASAQTDKKDKPKEKTKSKEVKK